MNNFCEQSLEGEVHRNYEFQVGKSIFACGLGQTSLRHHGYLWPLLHIQLFFISSGRENVNNPLFLCNVNLLTLKTICIWIENMCYKIFDAQTCVIDSFPAGIKLNWIICCLGQNFLKLVGSKTCHKYILKISHSDYDMYILMN